MSWPLALLLAGVILLALHWIYRAGYTAGFRKGIEGFDEIALQAYQVGWQACELYEPPDDDGDVEDLEETPHVRAQRQAAAEGRQ